MKMANSSQRPDYCLSSVESIYIFNVWFIVYLSFLPVFLFVLYIGFNKWKNQRSSASGNISHSDVFTFNTVTMEITNIIGSAVACYGYLNWNVLAVKTGGDMHVTTTFGQVFFHSLTCVERYLAVVHPVTYMRLKTGGAVTIRNISIAFVWIFSIAFTLLFRLVNNMDTFYEIVGLLMAILPMPLVVFCSVSALCVLIRPKPGDRKQIDQSKRTTVYTMVGIMGVLVLRLVFNVISYIILLTTKDGCVIMMSTLWSTLPSSLVLPLLFLHRAGKLPQCKYKLHK